MCVCVCRAQKTFLFRTSLIRSCMRRLKSKMGLSRHMRAIHVEQPLTCKICSKITPSKGALRSHMRYMHELQRDFHCSICDKSFKRDTELKEHMASHTGGILYQCPYCSKTCNSNANMHAHRKRNHPVEWARDRQIVR